MRANSDRTLFDGQSASAAAWQVSNDDVMGGRSTSSFLLSDGMAVFQGEVSLENNGGFASVRSLPAHLDLGGCDTFVVRVRGDGRRYKFTARTDQRFDRAIHQCGFITKQGDWEEQTLPFDRFVATFRGRALPNEPPLDPATVTSIGLLISDKQGGPFRLEIAWIKATTLAES